MLAVLAVPPWLLTTLTRAHLPGWPTSAQLRDWLTDPLTPATLTTGLIAVAWLLWLGMAYTITVTAARRLRAGTRWVRHLPLPTPWQAAATSIAGAAALTTAHTPTTHPPDPPTPVTADELQHPSATPQTEQGGVVVPGGWLPDDTAHHIAAAAALVWLRRRRAHQPGQPDTDATQLIPLPTTVTAVQAAIADQPPPAATTGAIQAPLPPAGLRLAGHGADHAARGLLVTRLLTALRDPADTTPVIVTSRALARLLPSVAETAATIPGLHVIDTLEQAAALLPASSTSTAADRGIPSLVLTAEPATAAPPNLRPNARVVTLDAGAPLPTWRVDRHGHTVDHQTGQPRPRMCVLDSTAATDLLAVLAQPTTAAPEPAASVPVRPINRAQAKIPRQATRVPPPTPRQPSEAAEAAVQLRVLGRPALLIESKEVAIRRSAALQILVFLAVHPDGATTTQLVHALWAGLPAHTVTGRLYTTLSDLRSTIRGTGAEQVVVHTEDRYHLEPRTDVDLWRLQAAAHHSATTDVPGRWQAVIDAYTGDLAAGHTWPWIDPPREATRRLVLDAHTNAAAAQTDPHERLRLLQAAIRIDPYNQQLHQLTADQLNALGDSAAAADLLHTHQQRLRLAGILDQP
ncbi:hypothetical protein Micau_1775 [Micromonospora aurantiaca ATCC 27029]|uniref:Bacterial transcriptional activator domain-containing protein n=1 Tax=Micromonospora aurantiaca (nom. illeg.) TaxID=47850 RepID=A0A6N3K2Q0_9ACTN|nr:hypothetical protein Micau_1775 [Micromonospora aurantiaca ATCC 27029]AXH91443.1 hypothetical protein DVH21_16755 [Micromonospora aurantiaca]